MENEWKKELSKGNKIEVDIKMVYNKELFSKRPERFVVEYKVNGKRFIRRFKND